MKKISTQKQTEYGLIQFETVRDGDCDLDLMAINTTGSLISAAGEAIGNCRFIVYRKKRNRPQLDADEIFSELDALSHSAMQIGEALMDTYEFELVYNFNTSCLLVADRVFVEPEYRGASLWKALYFATMEEALRPLKNVPDEYFFKAFPLEYEGNVTEENRSEFQEAERNLKVMYSIHLNAKKLCTEGSGCFMRAPVPSHLWR